jgi:hypothetical protein
LLIGIHDVGFPLVLWSGMKLELQVSVVALYLGSTTH